MAKVKTCAKQIKGASLSPYWTRVKYFTLVRFYTVSVLSGEKKNLKCQGSVYPPWAEAYLSKCIKDWK